MIIYNQERLLVSFGYTSRQKYEKLLTWEVLTSKKLAQNGV